ncbi:MAG: hypothetical protein AABY32_02440 [Nanoarchaeota archaeon]
MYNNMTMIEFEPEEEKYTGPSIVPDEALDIIFNDKLTVKERIKLLDELREKEEKENKNIDITDNNIFGSLEI